MNRSKWLEQLRLRDEVSRQRKKDWEKLSEPRPPWETWKRILSSKGFDPQKAKEQWEKIAKKKVDNN